LQTAPYDNLRDLTLVVRRWSELDLLEQPAGLPVRISSLAIHMLDNGGERPITSAEV
jgi:hypothetical protein